MEGVFIGRGAKHLLSLNTFRAALVRFRDKHASDVVLHYWMKLENRVGIYHFYLHSQAMLFRYEVILGSKRSSATFELRPMEASAESRIFVSEPIQGKVCGFVLFIHLVL